MLRRLREATGDRLAYAFRHFPNERAHPGAEFMARAAESGHRTRAGSGRCTTRSSTGEPPFGEKDARELAARIGLDMERFDRDIDSDEVGARVAEDLADAGRNGVSGTPTIFVDGVRYDGRPGIIIRCST